jgi:hypothetical protein
MGGVVFDRDGFLATIRILRHGSGCFDMAQDASTWLRMLRPLRLRSPDAGPPGLCGMLREQAQDACWGATVLLAPIVKDIPREKAHWTDTLDLVYNGP